MWLKYLILDFHSRKLGPTSSPPTSGLWTTEDPPVDQKGSTAHKCDISYANEQNNQFPRGCSKSEEITKKI